MSILLARQFEPTMNRNMLRNLAGATLLTVLNFLAPCAQARAAQAAAPPTSQAGSAAPVSYSSASQLNSLLADLEQSSQRAQGDLSKLRVAKWKTDSNTKHQTESNMESIQRNLQSALPAMVRELRDSP
ncbi:MAG: hypothetical protein JOY93_11735, partial [Acidobacteriales bacterium]|nr:hypothetical protein [Terriglobales bacterium]